MQKSGNTFHVSFPFATETKKVPESKQVIEFWINNVSKMETKFKDIVFIFMAFFVSFHVISNFHLKHFLLDKFSWGVSLSFFLCSAISIIHTFKPTKQKKT